VCYKPIGYLPFRERIMNADEQDRMKELCTAIAGEQDSHRLIGLVEELNRLLARKEERLKQQERDSAQSVEPSDKGFPVPSAV
jgi:hypothetical protein